MIFIELCKMCIVVIVTIFDIVFHVQCAFIVNIANDDVV